MEFYRTTRCPQRPRRERPRAPPPPPPRSRFGRYSGSSATSLEEDLREVAESDNQRAAVERLVKRFNAPDSTPLLPEDFLRDYGDARFGRFLLYLLVYRNKAIDWDPNTNVRLGFEGLQLLADFRPQWHHIFPRKYLAGKINETEKIEALANIAVIGPAINMHHFVRQSV